MAKSKVKFFNKFANFLLTKVEKKRDKIEKYYKMTNISTDAGMMKLLTYLRKLGIDDELEKMGASDGDTVRLCDFEFEYVS